MTTASAITTDDPLKRRISVVGCGRLDAPIAACLAATGFEVIAVDHNPKIVNQLNAGEPPIYETNLAAMLRLAQKRLRATTDITASVRDTDTTFILVPTPSEPGGGFSLKHVLSACEHVGHGLAEKKEGFHLVVLVSTVMPGATGGPVRQTLERSSGNRCGKDFGLCYSPEFVALGSVIDDYLNPDFILIGQSEPHSGDRLSAIYDRLCTGQPPRARMNLTNAELAKIAVNAFITTKITFANALAGICQHLPGADVDQVTGALGLDSRIGGKYLRGGVGYGGPCFPRDNQALAAVARSVQSSAHLAQAVDRVNRQQVDRVARLIKQHLLPGDVVGILGLAYKPHSDVVEQSQGLLLAAALAGDGWTVVAYDPAAADNARGVLGDTVRFASTTRACIEAADLAVIMTPWPQFAPQATASLWHSWSGTVVDPWRMLANKPPQDARYVAGGVGPATTAKRRTHDEVVIQPLRLDGQTQRPRRIAKG